MAICDICGEKIGFASSDKKLTLEKNGNAAVGNVDDAIFACDSCTYWMNRLKSGNTQAYYKIHDLIDERRDERILEFVSKWESGNAAIDEINKRRADAKLRQTAMEERERQLQAERKEEAIATAKAEKEKLAAKQAAISKMLISSGFNFDGYKITKYSGYISGDDAAQIPRSGIFGNNNGKNLTDALVKIRIQALKELKEAAYALGCNAIIGVDFDYLTLEPETATLAGGTRYEPYVICVTANGNAVVIEKE